MDRKKETFCEPWTENKFFFFRIMQMALVHDLAECIVGDITPHCGVSAEDKHQREDKAMEEICELLGDQGLPILNLFRVKF